MMKLKTLRSVVSSLDTNTAVLVEDALAKWGNNIQDVRYFRSSANVVFTFTRSGKRYFLRLSHEAERSVEALRQELAFVTHLSSRGLKVANPVPSQSNVFVESVSSPLGTFHAVVFEGLAGVQLEGEDLNTERYTLWGQALGRLHQLSSTCEGVKRPTWHEHLSWIRGTVARGESDALHLADRLEQHLTSLRMSRNSYGLIHGDFELDNLVWEGNAVKVLDFDDCAFSWFIADVAFALRDLFNDDPARVTLNDSRLTAFVEGYRRAKPLTDDNLTLLPVFLCFHNLWTFASLQRMMSDLTDGDRPEWLQKLVQRLLAKQVSYRETFALALEVGGSL